MHDGNESRDNHGVSVRKRRKGIYILPNLFTLAALFGGFYSVVMAIMAASTWPLWASFVPWCSIAWMGAWPA